MILDPENESCLEQIRQSLDASAFSSFPAEENSVEEIEEQGQRMPSDSAEELTQEFVSGILFDESMVFSSYLAGVISFLRTFPLLVGPELALISPALLENILLESQNSTMWRKLHARIMFLLLNRTLELAPEAVEKTIYRVVKSRRKRIVGPKNAVLDAWTGPPVRGTHGSSAPQDEDYHNLSVFYKLVLLINLVDWCTEESTAVLELVDGDWDYEDELSGIQEAELFKEWALLPSKNKRMLKRNVPLGTDAIGRKYYYFDLTVNEVSYHIFRTRGEKNCEIEIACQTEEEMEATVLELKEQVENVKGKPLKDVRSLLDAIEEVIMPAINKKRKRQLVQWKVYENSINYLAERPKRRAATQIKSYNLEEETEFALEDEDENSLAENLIESSSVSESESSSIEPVNSIDLVTT